MPDSVADGIRRTFERNARALELRPGFGRGTATTRVRLTGGLACEVDEGPWALRTDMTSKSGGEDSAPNPGILGRAALGTCLAVGYAMWAARRGLTITSLEVEVQADYDSRGMYGVGEVEAGYKQIRYVVTVESEASHDEVLAVLDEADAHSDYLNVFRNPQDVRREVRVLAASGTGDR